MSEEPENERDEPTNQRTGTKSPESQQSDQRRSTTTESEQSATQEQDKSDPTHSKPKSNSPEPQEQSTSDQLATLEAELENLQNDVDSLWNSVPEDGVEQLEEIEKRLNAHGQRLATIDSSLDELKTQLEDHKRRSEREREEIRKFAVEDFATEMIQVKDSLDTALEVEELESETAERLDIVSREFKQALQRANLEPIDDPEEAFDSLRHKVVGKTDSPDHQTNEIVEIRESGYEIGDRVLRPARVVLST